MVQEFVQRTFLNLLRPKRIRVQLLLLHSQHTIFQLHRHNGTSHYLSTSICYVKYLLAHLVLLVPIGIFEVKPMK